MPGITRDEDTDNAGGAIIKGSANVFANFVPVVRIGDLVASHGRHPCSAPIMIGGSGDVFTNNIETCRAGDPASCGHRSTGSGDVFVN